MGVGSSTPKAQQSETINWDNIETDKFSSSMSNFNGLSKDAKTLIASLNIPVITESDISDVNLNNILDKINNKLDKNDQYKFNKLLENVSYDSDNLSETSPFISSDMYNYLVNSNMSDSDKVKQTGGSKKSKSKTKSKSNTKSKSKSNTKSKSNSKSKKKGGAKSVDDSVDNLVDDSSDTTTTSSASSLSDILDSSDDNEYKKKHLDKNKNKHRKDVKHHKYEKHHKDEKKENVVNDDDDSKASVSNSELSGGELSYISSSAHTGGEFSDSSNSNSKSNSYSSSSSVQATVTNENTNVSMSVRTDDINLVSDY
jgi:hypothetical protein